MIITIEGSIKNSDLSYYSCILHTITDHPIREYINDSCAFKNSITNLFKCTKTHVTFYTERSSLEYSIELVIHKKYQNGIINTFYLNNIPSKNELLKMKLTGINFEINTNIQVYR